MYRTATTRYYYSSVPYCSTYIMEFVVAAVCGYECYRPWNLYARCLLSYISCTTQRGQQQPPVSAASVTGIAPTTNCATFLTGKKVPRRCGRAATLVAAEVFWFCMESWILPLRQEPKTLRKNCNGLWSDVVMLMIW